MRVETAANLNINIAQIRSEPGRIKRNKRKIIEVIHEAKKNNDNLVVLPELAIPGYASMDQFLSKKTIKKNKKALKEIAKETKGITVIVGFVDTDKKKRPDGKRRRYNSAAVLQDGKRIGVVHKTLLPNYGEFFEPRYFHPSTKKVEIFNCKGVKIGVQICEDLWDKHYPVKVTKLLAKKGAQVVINLSSSTFEVDKDQERLKLLKKKAKRHKVYMVYANAIGSFDGGRAQLVFDGQSMIVSNKGELLAKGKAFKKDQFSVNLDQANKIVEKRLSKQEQIYRALVMGVKDYFKRAGIKQAVLGLSGGIDSAVTAALVVAALGKDNVTGILMPSEFSSEDSINDAVELANNLGIRYEIANIDEINKVVAKLSKQIVGRDLKDITKQNIQARIRGILLMAFANDEDAMVTSTGNNTEKAVGYFTLYGDSNGGISPLGDIPKLGEDGVYALAKHINKRAKRTIIPKNTISKPPSAELTHNQTDERSLGIPYKILVPLKAAIIRGESTKKFKKEDVKKVKKLLRRAEFKRRQGPPEIMIHGESSFGGRIYPL